MRNVSRELLHGNAETLLLLVYTVMFCRTLRLPD